MNGTDEPVDDTTSIKFQEWGFKVDRLFEVAYRFYKRNESKAFHPTFDVRNEMNALILQARYGNYDETKVPAVGDFDLVGKSRFHQWSLLKGMSKVEAMSKFICELDKLCPIFKAYAEAVKISTNSSPNRTQDMPAHASNGNLKGDSDGSSGSTLNHNRGPQTIDNVEHVGSGSEIDEQLHAIRKSLSKQTFTQFKGYAEKQHPQDIVMQKQTIKTLQDQYFRQYISRMHPQLESRLDSETDTSKTSESMVGTHSSPGQVKNNPIRAHAANHNSEVITTTESISEHSPSHDDETNLRTEPSQTLLRTETVAADLSSTPGNDPVSHDEPNDIIDENKTIARSNQETVKLQSSIPIEEKASDAQISIRQHNMHELKNIGVFESYPEPKPIKITQEPKRSIFSAGFNLNLFPNRGTNDGAIADNTKIAKADTSVTIHEKLTDDPPTEPLPSAEAPAVNLPMPEIELPPPDTFNKPVAQMDSVVSNYEGRFNNVPVHIPPVASQTPPKAEIKTIDNWDKPAEGEDAPISEVSSGRGSPLQQSLSSYDPLEPASLVTKKGVVAEFRDSVQMEENAGIYTINQCTQVIMQVPTYPDGRYIYFEFATDDYDIGFGLDFVFDVTLAQPPPIAIFEEDDDDDDDDDDIYATQNATKVQSNPRNNDPESAFIDRKRAIRLERLSNTINILPTYRRDSHEEVYCVKHKYPGRGYYMLKFDNTYSMLRSKTLFYKICYYI